jgi:hypothetical protein
MEASLERLVALRQIRLWWEAVMGVEKEALCARVPPLPQD